MFVWIHTSTRGQEQKEGPRLDLRVTSGMETIPPLLQEDCIQLITGDDQPGTGETDPQGLEV